MSVITITTDIWDANRQRTLATLDEIAALPNAAEVLGWRPGDGRAHIAWQLMHIGITEELYATQRLFGDRQPAFAAFVDRFRGGSVPDDDIPGVEQIRDVLAQSRQHLKGAVAEFGDEGLETIPEPLSERGWTVGKFINVMAWHEPHHQGQAHITLNLWKAEGGS